MSSPTDLATWFQRKPILPRIGLLLVVLLAAVLIVVVVLVVLVKVLNPARMHCNLNPWNFGFSFSFAGRGRREDTDGHEGDGERRQDEEQEGGHQSELRRGGPPGSPAEFAAFCQSSPSSSSKAEIRDTCDLYDRDRNGLISAEELHLVLNRLNARCSREDCARMIQSVDKDGDGNVNFEEFKRMMADSIPGNRGSVA